MNTNYDKEPAGPRFTVWMSYGAALLAVIAGLTILWVMNRGARGCSPPTLAIGTNQYIVKTIEAQSDGSLGVPADKPGYAFWVKGTEINHVFALSPTDNNLALFDSVKSGDTATVTWADCNSTTYSLFAPDAGAPDHAALMDQSVSEITIVVQPGAGTASFVIKGEFMEGIIQSFNTPDTAEMQAEISLLGIAPSDDGKTLQVSVSIQNTGATLITFRADNVSLTGEDAAALPLERSEPGLPMEIQPGESGEFMLAFVRPSTATATLNILGVEYELEGY
jgi:hypothetical protein